jgi:hypothetical protein
MRNLLICNRHQIIKSRGIRLAGHVAYIGERKGAYKVLVGKLREKDHLEDPGLDGRIMLTWIFRKGKGGGAWTKLIWIRIETGCGLLKNDVMNLRFHKMRGFS